MSTRGVTVQPERGIRRPARRAVTEAGPLAEHGRQERQDRRRSFRRPERTVKTTRANQSGLGGRHLGIGLSVAGGIVAAYLFWEYVEQWPRYTTPVPTLVAWVILVAATAFAIAVVQRLSARMPDWLFAVALASGAVVIALDLAGSHAGADRGSSRPPPPRSGAC
ncbi:hypothetical protein [Cryobacterium sp. 10C3]|uniref:hypothetical protein n=1 Tax=Cryobacterium sp. 10C3 TaxID=3048577 RepID=UPI002AB5B0EC|nr:hypothetical protein [Cryobacterium sp. 10C3]MDY7557439.1 hypothetical protein [Cryobacterium sp. 10C3]